MHVSPNNPWLLAGRLYLYATATTAALLITPVTHIRYHPPCDATMHASLASGSAGQLQAWPAGLHLCMPQAMQTTDY